MQTKTISYKDALALCQRAEDHFFDRKALGLDGKKIQKIAVAFANADGGSFVVGISDDKDEPDAAKRWSGAPKIEDFNGLIQALHELNPSLELRASTLSCIHPDFPGFVLLVDIEKSAQVHKTSDNTVYQRKSAQSLPLKDPQKILELNFAKGATSYEDQPIEDARIEDVVESDEMANFLASISPSSDPIDFAVSQNIVRREDWKPKAAAVLLFAKSPSALMPKKCAVRIARYETKEDEPERDHLKATSRSEGPLYPLIQDTIKEITSIISSIQTWTTNGLKRMDYPPEAIWEIVVNAVIHRDYSISDDVHIRIFDNRVEVASPGRLPGYVTVSNIRDARYSRNPKLVRTLSRYPDPPNKDLGEGLNTVFQKMKDWKLKEPQIEERDNSVVVTISHTPLASPAEAILEFLNNHSTITNRQAREITGIKSENQMKTEFYKLRDAGIIEMVPELKGSAAAWKLK